jgi:hypothetical protein
MAMRVSRVPAALGFCLAVLWSAMGASRPDWVDRRPSHPDYYYGVGVCDRKGLSSEDGIARADARALADLASAISVEVRSDFLDRMVETSGLVREQVQAEIAASAAATLTGHERVGRWEDRRQYWACYRLSRAAHGRQNDAALREALTGARAMADGAARAEGQGDAASALRLHAQALTRVADAIGQPGADASGRSECLTFAVETIAVLQRHLGAVRLLPARERLPMLAGKPLNEPLAATLASGRPLANLPLRFSGMASLTATGQTDADGRAAFHCEAAAEADAGKRVVAELNLAGLCTNPAPSRLAAAMLGRLPAPRAVAVLHGCTDAADFAWRREFEAAPAQVVAAYRSGSETKPWPKMRDEVAGFLQGKGARLALTNAAPLSVAEAVTYAADPEGKPPRPYAGLLAVLVADGTVNRRKGESGGEECQFSGEIRLVFARDGRQVFASRFQGTGGWNPMGEAMCMDVLALHIAKRWQAEHLRRLTGSAEP